MWAQIFTFMAPTVIPSRRGSEAGYIFVFEVGGKNNFSALTQTSAFVSMLK